MEMIREWVKNIFMLIMAVTFIETLMPSSGSEKYVKFVFSIIIMATILSPVVYFLE